MKQILSQWVKKLSGTPKPVVPESRWMEVIRHLDLIRLERIERIFSPNMGNTGLETVYKSIVEYSSFLRSLNYQLPKLKEIPDFTKNREKVFIPLREWFMGPDGHYIDGKEYTQLFIEHAKGVLKQYVELEAKMDVISQSKVRLLEPVVSLIQDTTQTLVAVTQYSVARTSAIKTRY